MRFFFGSSFTGKEYTILVNKGTIPEQIYINDPHTETIVHELFHLLRFINDLYIMHFVKNSISVWNSKLLKAPWYGIIITFTLS